MLCMKQAERNADRNDIEKRTAVKEKYQTVTVYMKNMVKSRRGSATEGE